MSNFYFVWWPSWGEKCLFIRKMCPKLNTDRKIGRVYLGKCYFCLWMNGNFKKKCDKATVALRSCASSLKQLNDKTTFFKRVYDKLK